jgi:transposase
VRELQRLTRSRRALVEEKTATENLIRVHIDHIFCEFQGKSIWVNEKLQHLKPFSKLFGKGPRFLMRHHPHPEDIFSLGEQGLRKLSIRGNLKIRDATIEMLVTFARE